MKLNSLKFLFDIKFLIIFILVPGHKVKLPAIHVLLNQWEPHFFHNQEPQQLKIPTLDHDILFTLVLIF